MARLVKPHMGGRALVRCTNGGIVRRMGKHTHNERKFRTTSPGRKPRRTEKADTRADFVREIRGQLATNIKWLLDHSSAKGNLTKMAESTGVGRSSLKRALEASNSSQVDTISLIAAAYGMEPWQLLHPFRGDAKLTETTLQALERIKADIEAIKRRQ